MKSQRKKIWMNNRYILFLLFVLASCGEPQLVPTRNTVSGTWVNEIPGQTTTLHLATDGTLRVEKAGSALGPLGTTVVLGMLERDDKWSVGRTSISFTGDSNVELKILSLSSNRMALESIVTVNDGRRESIQFVRDETK